MEKNSNKPIVAFWWTLASAVGFAGFSGILKDLLLLYPLPQVVFFLVTPVLIFAACVKISLKTPFFPKDRLVFLLIRGTFGFTGWICYFVTIPHLPLAIASMCYVSMPLFVYLLAPILIGEKTKFSAIPWVIAAFIGILFMIDPAPEHFNFDEIPLTYLALGFLGSLCAGIGQIYSRKMSHNTSPQTIVFYFALIGCLITLPPTILDFQKIPTVDWGLFFVMGLGAILTQFTFTKAFKYASAGLVCTLGFLDEPACALIAYVFFGEALSIMQWTGLLIMGIGLSGLTLSKDKEKSPL